LATTRDIKRRIDSVRNTRKITRAMELVASAKLRRAQEKTEALRPYAQAMRRLMAQAARQGGGAKGLVLLDEREAEGTAVVVAVTGDRGLAGAFNVNVVRAAFATADRLREEGFSEGEVNRVVIVYNAFRSVLEQVVTTEQLLPVERVVILDEDDDGVEEEEREPSRGLALFEPDPDEFLKALLPTFIITTIFRAMLESASAELAARRSAMRNATDNAGALIDQYTLAMNRARQAAITQEILEVVAGADALQ
jgi:F-type H+-transporting ATPase subunit gamma